MNYMLEALNEAKLAFLEDEVPVGAVLVKNGEIIVKKHNDREKNNNILSHAEIMCIIEANKIEKTWKLYDYDLYVTLKPCSMCEAVIKQARIKNVYYLSDKLEIKNDYNRTNVCKMNLSDDLLTEYHQILSDFFKNKR